MKILQVVHDFLPKHMAGSEVYTYNLSIELKKRRHEVGIYCREDGYFNKNFTETDEEYNGLCVKRIYYNPIGPLKSIRKFLGMTFGNVSMEKHFKRFLEGFRPDVIHFQHIIGLSPKFISIAQEKKIPTVFTLHDYWFICPRVQLITPTMDVCGGPGSSFKCAECYSRRKIMTYISCPVFFLRRYYLNKILDKIDRMIAPSKFLRDKFIEHGIPEEKIIYSDYGMSTKLFENFKKKPSEKIRFGFSGTIIQHKGVHVLIRAFNKVKLTNVELKIYGDPEITPDYYKEISDLAKNPNIKFMGHFDNCDIAAILSEIDVLIVPSIWYENSPLTIHEAFIAKIPVITSNIGGMADLVQHMENGLLFKVGDSEDLYRKIKLIIDDPSLIEKLSSNIKPVKTIEENAEEIEKIYKGLLKNNEG